MPPRSYIPKFKLWHPEQKANQAPASGSSASNKPMTSMGKSAGSGQPNDTDPCDWHGDRASPKIDDLAHECAETQRTPRPDEVCGWKGDVVEPELNDLDHEYIKTLESSGPNECAWEGDVAEPEPDDLAPGHAPKPSSSSKPKESNEDGTEQATEGPVINVFLAEPATKPPKKESQQTESGQEKPSAIINKTPDAIKDPAKPRQGTEATPPSQEPPQEDAIAAQALPGLPFKIPGLPNMKIPGLAELPFKVPGISSETTSGPQSQQITDVSPQPEVPTSTSEPPAPAEEYKPEGSKKTKEERAKEKAKEREEKSREKKAKEKAEKERKTKEKAERKAKEKENREKKEREKQDRKAKKDKTNNHDGPPPPLPPGSEGSAAAGSERTTEEQARDEEIEEVKKKLTTGWEGLPSINDLANSMFKVLPGNQDQKPPGDKTQEDAELCAGPQLLDNVENSKNLQEPTKKVQNAKGKKKDSPQQGMDGVMDEPSDYPSKPPTTSLCTAGINHTGASSPDKGSVKAQPIEPSSKTASSSLQSILHGTKSCSKDCGHPESDASSSKCQSQPSQALDPHCSESKTTQRNNQNTAPGMLKRASCLCGALPPKPSEYAEYDTPTFNSPALATPGEKDDRADGSYF